VPGTTPTGKFGVARQVNGYDVGPLGVLYRPKYFHDGVAVHGYPSVPPYPASHGCVRVTNAAMDWLWANGALPIGGPVWVY
jgi:lipoprotein-anchoring transpeptidase ErfK/SrfK